MGSVDGGEDGKPVAVRMGGDMVGGFAMMITGSRAVCRYRGVRCVILGSTRICTALSLQPGRWRGWMMRERKTVET
jgi:hypothetical protein